ncbi:hypothetical protein [Ruegeria sp.]|uniref:hypothetical protein n=1 Tax=Ruegeria sp. TaxID=1879320 RepID=UPI0023235AF2|nr:hypothetical protein [Ruegeria sp.]MDA7966945.1 hypothetical protein [Ruegeria sp.]
MKVFDAQATAEALPFDALINQMETLFAKGLTAPGRHRHTMPMSDEPGATLLLMSAWTETVGCVKVVTTTPGNSARKLPAIAGSVLVFYRTTGAHLALLDGAVLTARRTAAASALAARYLAPDMAQQFWRSEFTGCGTEPPFAHAAFADAASFRGRGMLFVTLQRIS